MRIGIRIGRKPVAKSFYDKVDGVIKAVMDIAEMQKARAGLVRKEVEVHRGGKTFKQNRWVRPDEVSQGRSKKAPEQGGEKKTAATEKLATEHKRLQQQFFDGKVTREQARSALLKMGVLSKYVDGELDAWESSEHYKKGAAAGKKPDSEKPKMKLGIRKPDQGKSKFKNGDKVSGVDVNGKEVSGTVTAVGADGVTIDGQFHVEHGKAKYEDIDDYMKPEKRDMNFKPTYQKGQKVTVSFFDGKTDFVDALVEVVEQYASNRVIVRKDNGEKMDVPIERIKKQGQAEMPKRTYIPPEKFNAADYAKQWEDSEATADEAGKEYILKSFGAESETIANAIRDTDSRNKKIEDEKQLTTDIYRIPLTVGESARYTPEREKLHGEIMIELLSPAKIRTALPPPGQSPKFIILGGRGGSGKSWFKNNLYDPNTTVILDADEIKERLPEYKGWNANQVHEESSDILEQMIATCIKQGLNVVLDATMKTADSALAKVFRFKSAGYKTEAHYMHCPKQVAAQRAIKRFRDDGKKGPNGEPPEPYSGRYVPVTAVLQNTTNEDSFEQVRRIVDEWSFRDSNGKGNEPPILISEGKKEVKKSLSKIGLRRTIKTEARNVRK